MSGSAEIDEHIVKHRRAIVGHFSGPDHGQIATFQALAEKMRDGCHFLVDKMSSSAGESGATVQFKSSTEELTYEGDINDEVSLNEWATDHCNPLVREITFTNGEELTEEGLPFLIMFYDPANQAPLKEFTQVIRARFPHERGSINFITADGTKFSHPLRHLGLTKKDLPVLAIDTFKHMYHFKKFSNIHKGNKLEKFIEDMHSGQLHYIFHHPDQAPKEDDDEQLAIEGDSSTTISTSITADDDAKKITTKPDTLKEKLEEAQDRKAPEKALQIAKADAPPAVAPAPGADHKDEQEPDHDHDENDAKPIAVKSVLKHLRPNEHRYSFANQHDEL